ncbi:MAG: hypothetical protein COY38_05030 [Candidatus Aenigmarchaeota archaeon CG_4_10_14_0_8_um_filter_37_24]|nr:hypothetical protein [Candidatus Aenigmarchaeota archaeon]OIN86367.1 MAG: hypothetical protein AUJ50_03850 [Candidatus Aenigmarchaeota archaeon CG1_02_38_14]PIV68619.1 MAG: hypothetical protein COS07_03515 [Candidatus Aenigmarchaeota archaeon CG01_land_8_20_14_3_00_37_9]PIW40763.1 MAG: hypothetical protein COW21_05485 [Candidatus Aenigmarchaeota archaeon CG15_BIG_FIL_POST_REV_8_21_14_020_37_27]PIX50751.1 MAG: hypothetical protein COZ52_02550 [Candidatus Aenigmarchaeota archaeon CG_4_8_14_3_u
MKISQTITASGPLVVLYQDHNYRNQLIARFGVDVVASGSQVTLTYRGSDRETALQTFQGVIEDLRLNNYSVFNILDACQV